jgi:guanine deaminase
VLLQTHLNENPEEIAAVRRMFPWAADYLAVYERFALSGPRSLFAHNVHASDTELARLAVAGAAVAHCPTSNSALGSGMFAMRRHWQAGVKFALGSDVGAGTGLWLGKEALEAYLVQRLLPEGQSLGPADLLYLATLAGAEALCCAEETGNFEPGKSADWIHVVPLPDSALAAVWAHTESVEQQLAAFFTLGGPETIREVRVMNRRLL